MQPPASETSHRLLPLPGRLLPSPEHHASEAKVRLYVGRRLASRGGAHCPTPQPAALAGAAGMVGSGLGAAVSQVECGHLRVPSPWKGLIELVHLLSLGKQAFTSPMALKLLKRRHMGCPSSVLWEGSGGPAPCPAREKPRVWGAGWHQAGALLCSCGSQEGVAPELRPINKLHRSPPAFLLLLHAPSCPATARSASFPGLAPTAEMWVAVVSRLPQRGRSVFEDELEQCPQTLLPL
uniref:Uncharacterized protein n=1 Tax=Rangifer tarandus platyrhynchus TaxID=3082113 RepID=A0ACB0EV49_RANTA|nr:unnamed protein product [Rangifer tarandus platyrhynchus]